MREGGSVDSLRYRDGRLALGCKADVNRLDVDKLMLNTLRKVEDPPGGSTSFVQDCEGIAARFVAGGDGGVAGEADAGMRNA